VLIVQNRDVWFHWFLGLFLNFLCEANSNWTKG